MTAELVCAATDRDAWLTARRSGVTATDIVTILGLNPWGSEYALYWEKLGKLPPFEGNARTALGTALEPYIESLWPNPDMDLWTGGLYRNAERPWQLATPDRLKGEYGERGPVELKTWDDHDRTAWEGTVPPRVRAQVLWQMDTLGVGVGHVGVLFLPSGEFESRVIEHDDIAEGLCRAESWRECLTGQCQQCADVAYMRQVGEAFWGRVREGLPPFPDGSPATLAAVKALHAAGHLTDAEAAKVLAATDDTPGSITPGQWQRVAELYLRLPGMAKMLPIGELAGRDVDNLADLSAAEADRVINGLEAILR